MCRRPSACSIFGSSPRPGSISPRRWKLRTDSPEVFNLGGVLFEMLEDYDRAKRYYGQAIRLNRNYEPAQQNMRRIYELFQFGSSKEPFNLGET